MDRSHGSIGVLVALFVAAFAVSGAPIGRVQAADQEPADDGDVNTKALEVDRCLRGAEEELARGLRSGDGHAESAGEAKAAAVSLAKLLAATRDDGRRAAAAMQWLIDNAPQ